MILIFLVKLKFVIIDGNLLAALADPHEPLITIGLDKFYAAIAQVWYFERCYCTSLHYATISNCTQNWNSLMRLPT